MAGLAIDATCMDNSTESAWQRLSRRLRVLARASRIRRAVRARNRLLRAALRDPRTLADVSTDPALLGSADPMPATARGRGGFAMSEYRLRQDVGLDAGPDRACDSWISAVLRHRA